MEVIADFTENDGGKESLSRGGSTRNRKKGQGGSKYSQLFQGVLL